MLRAANEEKDPEVKALLLRALQYFRDHGGPTCCSQQEVASTLPLRISAMMSLGHQPDARSRDSLLTWVDDSLPAVRTAAIDALQNGGVFSDGGSYRSVMENDRWFDALTMHRVGGLMAYNAEAKKKAVHVLNTDTSTNPYAEAERIKARSMVDNDYRDTDLEQLVFSDAHPAIRQAAFGVMADRNLSGTENAPGGDTRYAAARSGSLLAPRLQHRRSGLDLRRRGKLTGMNADDLGVLFPAEIEQRARATLHPLRDLEAVGLLDHLAAKRDGMQAVAHKAPPFNHPIDPAKLRTLPQGQRYRITTAKGTIILATDVNECPGSSLAFDSLVTAGYYNGKAFSPHGAELRGAGWLPARRWLRWHALDPAHGRSVASCSLLGPLVLHPPEGIRRAANSSSPTAPHRIWMAATRASGKWWKAWTSSGSCR